MRCIFYVAHESDSTIEPKHKMGRAKERERKLFEALRKGALQHGDTIDMMPSGEFDGVQQDCDLAIVFGCKGSSRRISEAYLKQSKQIMFLDKPHFRPIGLGEKGMKNLWRLSVDGFYPHHYFRCGRPSDRFDRWGITFKPWRDDNKNGKHILVAGSSQKFHDFHLVRGSVHDYYKGILRRLNDGWTGPMVYRPKPSYAVRHSDEIKPMTGKSTARMSSPQDRIWKELENCWCLVTWGSNAALDALISGVPILTVGDSIAKTMSKCDDSNELTWRIDDPWHPTDSERHQFFCDIAYCQFTPDEMKSGEAWGLILEQTPKAMLTDPAFIQSSDKNRLIEQYKFLHARGNFFKGLSTCSWRKEIGEMIQAHAAETLLDYGCGKGEQYKSKREHTSWTGWLSGLPTMYDPAVPEFEKPPPEGQLFDGVLCIDMLEHIEEKYLDEVIDHVFSYALKFAFFAVHTGLARKHLPDGRNCHLTIKDRGWWRKKINARNFEGVDVRVCSSMEGEK